MTDIELIKLFLGIIITALPLGLLARFMFWR